MLSLTESANLGERRMAAATRRDCVAQYWLPVPPPDVAIPEGGGLSL